MTSNASGEIVANRGMHFRRLRKCCWLRCHTPLSAGPVVSILRTTVPSVRMPKHLSLVSAIREVEIVEMSVFVSALEL